MESFETRWTLGDCLVLGSFININGVTIWVLGTRGGKICLWPPCRDAGIVFNNVVGDEQQSIWIFVTWYNWKWQVVFWVMLWYWHSEVADSWRDHQRKAPDLRGQKAVQWSWWFFIPRSNMIPFFESFANSQLMFNCLFPYRSSQLHHFAAAYNFFQLQVRWISVHNKQKYRLKSMNVDVQMYMILYLHSFLAHVSQVIIAVESWEESTRHAAARGDFF